MSSIHPCRRLLASFFTLVLVTATLAAAAPNGIIAVLDAEMPHASGLCVVLGLDDPDEAVAIARSGRFLVHALDPNPAHIDATREVARAAGISPRDLVIERWAEQSLPHAENIVDLVIADGLSNDATKAEILRALRPEGKALLRADGKDWTVLTKPPLEGVDDWSHWEHGPDNNPASSDTVIKAPYMTQWFAEPYYIAMPAITTVAGGRTFLAMGHIAHHRREEPWLNTLLARNGYNGQELWRRKLPDGYLVHRSAFVATDDVFYMIDPSGAGCLLLDPETGAELDRIRIPEAAGQWKWMALEDGVLYVLAGPQADPPETTIVRSDIQAWSWGELSQGYYEPRVPWGFGRSIAAYDIKERRLLWTHEEDADIDSRAMAIGGGHVYFYCPDARIARLDKTTGAPGWVNEDPDVRALIEEPGRGLGSTPGFRSSAFSLYTPKGIFFQAQTRMNVVALDTEDGRLLWHRTKTTNNPNMLYANGKLLVGIGPEGSTLVLDPRTGETLEDLGFKKRSCVRLTSTPDSFFVRGYPEGVTRYDRNEKVIRFDGSMRPACNDGVIGANGLLYIGPWLCDCNLALMGTAALCSAPDIEPAAAASRLERGSTYSELTFLGPEVNFATDWPTARGSVGRTGGTWAAVAPQVDRVWSYDAPADYLPTAPVVAGGRLFVAGNDGLVRAFSAQDGTPLWTFPTAGPILQPPTVWQNYVYVGSGDGYIYAIEMETGELWWRFRAAPVERRIMVYGSLCSTWPVNSGVLVEDGVAYAAAGIIDYDGTYVYALDAITGELRWQNGSSGHVDPDLRKGVSAQGGLTLAQGRLWMAGGNIVSPAPYDAKTGAYVGPSAGDGSPRAPRGQEIGVFDKRYAILGGRLRYSAVENVVSPDGFWAVDIKANDGNNPATRLCAGKTAPAWDDKGFVRVNGIGTPPEYFDAKQVAKRLEKGPEMLRLSPEWTARRFDGRDVVSLALSPDVVLAVCEAAIPRNLQTRWTLCMIDRETGRIRGEVDLSGPALPGGLAVDRDGRVFVVSRDGHIDCFGGGSVFEADVASAVETAKGGGDAGQRAVARLQEMLRSSRGATTRDLIIAGLDELGIEAGRDLKAQGRLIDWQLLGPIPWNNDKFPLDAVLVGEPKIDLGRTYKVEGDTLDWIRSLTFHPDGLVDLANLHGPLEWVAMYAHTTFELDKAQDILVKIGTNDGFKAWLNGREIGRFDGGRAFFPDADTFRVKGKKGTNEILLKVTQMGNAWGFAVRLTDLDEEPINLGAK